MSDPETYGALNELSCIVDSFCAIGMVSDKSEEFLRVATQAMDSVEKLSLILASDDRTTSEEILTLVARYRNLPEGGIFVHAGDVMDFMHQMHEIYTSKLHRATAESVPSAA